MTYLPSPIVTIGSVDFTSNVIGQISISRGRRAVYETVNAGFASIELRDVGDLPSFVIGATVQVTIEDSGGDPVKVFTGLLSDISSQTVVTGGEPLVFYRLQAVGPLATINRRVRFVDGRVQEDDAERVRAAVLSAGRRWEELPFALAWEDAEGTWDTFDPLDLSLIDDGLFQIATLPPADSGYNALSVAQDAAFSGDGFLFETADGRIGYQNANRRRERQAVASATFPSNVLDVAGLNVTQQLADITNRVTVEFESGSQSRSLASSIADFGLYESSFGTNLVDSLDANTRAFEFLLRRSDPHRIIDTLPFNLLGLSDELRTAVLSIELNDSVLMTDVPARVGFTEFQGFVEGISLTVTPFQADVVFNVSNSALSVSIPSTGGRVSLFDTDEGIFAVHEFRNDGEFRLFEAKNVDYVVIAGGGGGGEVRGQMHAGGGGAGGVVVEQDVDLAVGVYPVIVGAGGVSYANGGDSQFLDEVGVGGGAGGGHDSPFITQPGANGGSGGGGTSGGSDQVGGQGVVGQGNDGGEASGSGISDGAGGGGGAGVAGGDGLTGNFISDQLGGDGGDGVELTITGSPVVYAAGGGGGSIGNGGIGGGGIGGEVRSVDTFFAFAGSPGGDATGIGCGGGGAAGGLSFTEQFVGGAGSDGAVFIRYQVL